MALALEERGFDNVHPLIGGFDAWQQANLPVKPKKENAAGRGM